MPNLISWLLVVADLILWRHDTFPFAISVVMFALSTEIVHLMYSTLCSRHSKSFAFCSVHLLSCRFFCHPSFSLALVLHLFHSHKGFIKNAAYILKIMHDYNKNYFCFGFMFKKHGNIYKFKYYRLVPRENSRFASHN